MLNSQLVAKLVIGAMAFAIAVLVFSKYVPLTEAQRLNKQCQSFGKGYIKDHADMYSDQDKIYFFYSKRLDTCVMTSENELQNEFSILDIQQNYLKDIKNLFWCDKDGVDNTVLEKAEHYNGFLFSIKFSEFLDDGKGGLARAVKTYNDPHSRSECRAAHNEKLKEIK